MFNMLHFALEYQPAVDALAAERSMELRVFELNEAEWKILRQLRDALKVHQEG